MKQLQVATSDGKLIIKPKKILIALLAAAILMVFLEGSLCFYLGPFMALAFAYLYFSGYTELITAIIVVANDALGTMIGGSISFPYLLLMLALVRFVLSRKVCYANMGYLAVALILILQLYFAKSLDFRGCIYTFAFILALIVLPRNEETLQRFFCGITFAVVLIGLHACITGGVAYYELNEYSTEVLRRGILGVGIGDSNFSCYLLLIGMVCLWYAKNVGVFWKVLFTGVLLYAMMITLSTTGILALVLVGLLVALLGKKKSKSFIIFLIIALVVVLLFQNYTALPTSMRNETLDGYIARVEEKFFQMQAGNYDDATTKRSYLAEAYIRYIFAQPVLPMLFGGNKLVIINNMIAHNTFLGLILQVGLIGAGAIIAWMIWKLIKQYQFPAAKGNRNIILVLKVLSVFFAFTLSIYNGNSWALWFYFLMIL